MNKSYIENNQDINENEKQEVKQADGKMDKRMKRIEEKIGKIMTAMDQYKKAEDQKETTFNKVMLKLHSLEYQ